MNPPPERNERHPARPPGVRPYLRAPAPEQPAPPTAPVERLPAVPTQPGTPAAAPRPFVITSGRVDGGDPDIGVETQVTAQPGGAPARLPPEARAIVDLCAEPLSVAEISARLRLHLGVTRILVGDLRAAGHLAVHVLDHESPDPDTILRVIRGLRAIS